MNAPRIGFSGIAQRLFACLSFFGAIAVYAKDVVGAVSYSPTSQNVEGNMPYSQSYVVNITSPSNLVGSATVGIVVTPTTVPVGDAATAATYIRLSSSQLTFTGPLQTLPLTVTFDLPDLGLPPGSLPVTFTYQLTTQGWPMSGVTDTGHSINARATPPTDEGAPPVVSIANPADNATFQFQLTDFPVQIPLAFESFATAGEPILSVDAAFGLSPLLTTVPISLTTTGIGTPNALSTGTMTVLLPGTYIVRARATNSIGTATDTNQFRVTINAPPPVVAIASPLPNSTYTYRLGDAATLVPVSFSATSSFGGIRTLTATLDGVPLAFSPGGLNTLLATGATSLFYTTGGTHVLEVTATDDNGTATPATTTFTVNVIAPTPTIAISAPANGATFNVPSGDTTVDIPFAFTTTSNLGFNVDSVSATLDGSPTVITSTAGLGTPNAVSTGTLVDVAPGTHTLTATGVSAGIVVSTSVNFTVQASSVPPTVVINTPPAGSTYTRLSGGPALSIPLTFTGTSNTLGGVITSLTASLDGNPLSVSSSTLGQNIATGTATMTVTAAGTHTINVAAKDAFGIASATRTFTVVVVQGKNICGQVFFDVDFDGNQDNGEFGLNGVTVKLLNSASQVIATDVTSCYGTYSFSNLSPGNYIVSAVVPTGLGATTLSERSVTVAGSHVKVPDIGFGLNFSALRTLKADGNSHGFWKANLEKAIAGKTKGVQVSAAKLNSYTDDIGDFALSPYDCMTMKKAVSILSSTSSKSTDVLSKQLIASEYNYQHGAYIGGNQSLTFLFLWWGEYVLDNSSSYSTSYLLWAKDWFDAYNNSHGGVVAGPAP